MPRRLPLDELVALLVSEHAQMLKGLNDLKESLGSKDYPGAKSDLERVEKVFRQHIADEESQVLKVLIDAYGVKGADEAIQVFRQHRPIYTLMEELRKYSVMTPDQLSKNQAELTALLQRHTKAEEERIFPWALSSRSSQKQ